jgi:hypothetical protein
VWRAIFRFVPSPAALRFPCSRILLPRTRLAYVHLRNLLNDAKRDRAARISGYVAVSLPDELVILYLLGGEVVNATIRDAKSCRVIAIANALEKVPPEPEYGEICFNEADEEQLGCMYITHAEAFEPWPAGMNPQDPSALFPYLMALTFDGVVEIVTGDYVNYLVFRNGSVARAYLSGPQHGTIVERVTKLFARDKSELKVARWGVPGPLPIQAPPALVQAYQELADTLVKRLVDHGRDSAPAIAEHARQNLIGTHPVLDCFALSGRPAKELLADTPSRTTAIAAWIREVMWAAVDHDALSPDELLKELTWERRHMFQSAGFYDEMPWKVL